MRKVHLNLPGGGRPTADINVTPLVDVVLVLLIIFMVVTPLLEKDIEVRIPNTEEIPEDFEVPPDQLVVSLDDKGGLFINSQPVTKESLVDELKPLLDAKKAEDKLVFFAPDEHANYGLLVAALDGAKQAGATVLGMMTDPAPPVGAFEATPPGAPAPPAAPPGKAPPPPRAPAPPPRSHPHPAPARKHR